MEPATIISGAALVLAIVSPVVSSLISGHYRIKELKIKEQAEKESRQQEILDVHRATVIENYISSVGKFCNHGDTASIIECGKYMGEIYLYVDEANWPLLDSIYTAITVKHQPPVKEFQELCKILSHDNIRKKYQA